jgi:sec-independent protein translocase protein TatA
MHPIFAFGMPGFPELIIILLVVLVLFGAKRLPDLARSLGSSLNEFRKAKEEFQDEIHKDENREPAVKPEPSREG